MKTNRSNFLCGFMGAGKSTILKEIDNKENITCMDLDLHIENLYGKNTHHIIESCFKSLAISLREAVMIDIKNSNNIPSTKGTLSGGI